ncbi:MAG: A24 family peptidase [Microthrixaceae bacterium]
MALLIPVVLAVSLLAGWAVTVPLHRFREDDEGEGFAVSCPAECSSCGTEVTPPDVVPIISWVGAGRNCATCGTRRDWSWVAPQVAIPVLALVTTLSMGQVKSLPAYLWLVVVLVVASVIDLRTMLIPREVVWAGLGGGVVMLAGISLWLGEWGHFAGAIVGAVGYFGFLFISSILSPMGMGMGDVRLGSVLGLYLGWIAWPLVAVALLLGSVVGITQGVVSKGLAGRKEPFPFGPALAMGALVTIWAHQPILDVMLGN